MTTTWAQSILPPQLNGMGKVKISSNQQILGSRLLKNLALKQHLTMKKQLTGLKLTAASY
jgi:hypothetical protein